MPTSSSRCRRRGSTSAPWPTSTTSPPASASSITCGCGSRPSSSTSPAPSSEHGITDYRIVESAGATEGAPRRRQRRADRRHHHDRRDARRQRLPGARRRRDPAQPGQSGRLKGCRLVAAGAGDRARHPRSHRSTGAGQQIPRGPHPLRGMRRGPARAKPTSASASRPPFGGPTSSGMLTLHCPPGSSMRSASFLREHGAETVSVVSLDYVFDRENPLFAKLEAFLRR